MLVIVVGGPTASGKTNLAFKLAQEFQTEIISADSRQIYKELNIGVAKPKTKILDSITHHFISHISIHDEYNAGIYEREAISLIKEVENSKEIIIVAGGSGLYIQAIVNGFDEFPEISTQVKEKIELEYAQKGLEYLQKEIKIKDPALYEKVDVQNPRRLIRALGVILQTGRPYSSFVGKKKKERNFRTLYFQPEYEREKLYKTIDKRVDMMIDEGLLAEVQSLYEYRNMRSLQTVGYQELFDHMEGNCTFANSINQIKQNSRRYAKRQITWFKKHGNYLSVSRDNFSDIIRLINKENNN
jgi:tRNA dimethylallyltransferase